MYVVAVTGGRENDKKRFVFRTLDELHSKRTIGLIVHGAATGVDTFADYWADRNGVLQCKFPVTRGSWSRLGRGAGMIRNKTMLTITSPLLLVAFPGGKGTSGCVREASKLGIAILDLRAEDG